jgi:hypothetical protein
VLITQPAIASSRRHPTKSNWLIGQSKYSRFSWLKKLRLRLLISMIDSFIYIPLPSRVNIFLHADSSLLLINFLNFLRDSTIHFCASFRLFVLLNLSCTWIGGLNVYSMCNLKRFYCSSIINEDAPIDIDSYDDLGSGLLQVSQISWDTASNPSPG